MKTIEEHFLKNESFEIPMRFEERTTDDPREVTKLAQDPRIVTFNFLSMMLDCEDTKTHRDLLRLPESFKPFRRQE